MSVNVAIAGQYFEEDLKYLKNGADLKLRPASFWGAGEDFRNSFRDADLVIIPLFGTDISEFIIQQEQNPIIQEFFSLRKPKKVVWTFDCHHQTLTERMCQPLFDTFYLAHSPYLPAYNPEKTRWLPTCYCHFSIDKLVENASKRPPEKRLLLLPCKPYDLGDRDYVMRRIAKILEARAVSAHVGPFASTAEYMDELLMSKICINISLYDDLNIRNFDTWACNRILLSNHTPDHDLVSFDRSHTYFYERDLSNFEEMLDKALSDSLDGIRSAAPVVKEHTLMHRYIEIINKELGTNYFLDTGALSEQLS